MSANILPLSFTQKFYEKTHKLQAELKVSAKDNGGGEAFYARRAMLKPFIAAKTAAPARQPAEAQDCWADLFSVRHLAIIAVMAGGILLYSMNLYFTAALCSLLLLILAAKNSSNKKPRAGRGVIV